MKFHQIRQQYIHINIKLKSFKSSEHINKKRMGPTAVIPLQQSLHNTHRCVTAVVIETPPDVMSATYRRSFIPISKYFLVKSIVTPVLTAYVHIFLKILINCNI